MRGRLLGCLNSGAALCHVHLLTLYDVVGPSSRFRVVLKAIVDMETDRFFCTGGVARFYL